MVGAGPDRKGPLFFMVKLACFSDIEEHFKAWVPALAKAIRDYPAGCGTEGKVEAQWYTRRGVKTVRWMVRTSRFTTSPPHIRLGPDARAEAFRLIFPERAIKMEILKKLRVLQRVKAVLPSSPVIRVKDVSERLRIGVVLTKELHTITSAPLSGASAFTGGCPTPWQMR